MKAECGRWAFFSAVIAMFFMVPKVPVARVTHIEKPAITMPWHCRCIQDGGGIALSWRNDGYVIVP
ncbi:MAG: hypothetical protein UHZ01_05135 [Prevotella sp.]|nr:hypothetical protein [Prevotella sp.]